MPWPGKPGARAKQTGKVLEGSSVLPHHVLIATSLRKKGKKTKQNQKQAEATESRLGSFFVPIHSKDRLPEIEFILF